MSVIESPQDSLIQLIVDPTAKAIRTSLHPREYNNLTSPPLGGHYRLATQTGLTTIIAAAGGLFSMRWTSAVSKFILQRIKVSAVITTAFAAAQEISVDLVRVKNFSAADSGGTALIPINDSYKKSPTMTDSVVSDMRVATTAALTDGTGTAMPALSSAVLPLALNAVGSASEAILFDTKPGEEAPLEFIPNSGFRIRVLLVQGATGVVRFHFVVDWAEVPYVIGS